MYVHRFDVEKNAWETVGHTSGPVYGRIANMRLGNKIYVDAPERHVELPVSNVKKDLNFFLAAEWASPNTTFQATPTKSSTRQV